MRKMLLAGLATAVVIASPVFAQAASHHRHAHFGAYAQSPDQGLGGDYVGTDPDANVQLNLLKESQTRD